MPAGGGWTAMYCLPPPFPRVGALEVSLMAPEEDPVVDVISSVGEVLFACCSWTFSEGCKKGHESPLLQPVEYFSYSTPITSVGVQRMI
jgi:hypothetical protein